MIFFSSVAPPLRDLSHRLESLVSGKLWLQVLIGLALGIVVGLYLQSGWHSMDASTVNIITGWLALPGQIFLGLIKMVMIPLVGISIIRGLGTSKDPKAIRSHGIKLILFVLCTTLIAVMIGIGLSKAIQPGSYLEVDNGHLISSVEEAPRETIKFSILEDSPRLISNIIPKNPFSALIEGDMLAIVVFSILLGVAFSTHSAKETAPLFKVLNSFLDILMTIIKWAMFLSPWAVFGLMAQNASQLGVSALLGMSVFIVTVLLGLASLLMVYLLIAWVFTRHSPWEFLRNIAPVQLLAFSTSSSAAVMPLSIQVAEEKLGVDTSTAEFVIPLGTTMNMAGTALYQATTLLFLAQMSGIQLGGGQLALIIVSIIASSIGAPGTPGVSLVVLSAIAENFGIPVAGIAMILGIDRLLDMCRTTINVTGDLTACAIMNQAPQKSPSFTDRMKFSGEPA